MSPLESYQRALLGYLYASRPPEPPDPAITGGSGSPERIALGLTIYRRNLIFGLCRALGGTYPLCRDVLGEGNFNFLCKQYLHAFPSRVRDLGDYGERFAEFLSEREEIRDYPFLADVARLEWLVDRAARLPREAWIERPDLDLAERGTDELQRLRRSVLPLRTRFAILEVWSDHRRGGVQAVRAETIVRRPQHLLVWSDGGSPRVAEVPEMLWRGIAGAAATDEPAGGRTRSLSDE